MVSLVYDGPYVAGGLASLSYDGMAIQLYHMVNVIHYSMRSNID